MIRGFVCGIGRRIPMKQQDGIQHIQEEEHDVHYNVIIFNFLRKPYKIECRNKKERKTSKDEPKDVQTRFCQLQIQVETKVEVDPRARTESDMEETACSRRPVQDVGTYTGGAYTGGVEGTGKSLGQGHLLLRHLFYHIIHRLVNQFIDLIRNGLYDKLLYQEGGYSFRVNVHRNSLLLDELIDRLLQYRQRRRIVRHKRRHDLTCGMGIELVQKRPTLDTYIPNHDRARTLPSTRQRKQEKSNPHSFTNYRE